MLVDNAARSSIYYFMDGFSGYNQSKWAPNYDGPYMVKKAFLGGALLLSWMDGEDLVRLVNSDSIKKYYAWCILCFPNH